MKPNYELERVLMNEGAAVVIGCDEAGRGALVGSVTAASVYIPPKAMQYIKGKVDDSKKLTAKKREALANLIKATCRYSVEFVDRAFIDEHNILEATKSAIRRTISNNKADHALIDGNMVFDSLYIPYTSVVKGDSKSLSIACASIIAKVDRDAYMLWLDERYPKYGFAQHKGYGTKAHLAAIAKYGPCPEHRRTFKGVEEYVTDEWLASQPMHKLVVKGHKYEVVEVD